MAWISWARHSRSDPLETLAAGLRMQFDVVVRSSMLDKRSNVFVEAMNGLMQQDKRCARSHMAAACFINIAYLRLNKLMRLPTSPFDQSKPI